MLYRELGKYERCRGIEVFSSRGRVLLIWSVRVASREKRCRVFEQHSRFFFFRYLGFCAHEDGILLNMLHLVQLRCQTRLICCTYAKLLVFPLYPSDIETDEDMCMYLFLDALR